MPRSDGASHIYLRTFKRSDFDLLSRWLVGRVAALEWGGPAVPYPLNRQFLATLMSEVRATPPERFCWTATVGGLPCGHLQAIPDWCNRTAHLCRVLVAPDFRMRGIAREMLALVVDHLFRTLQFQHVDLNVYGHNRQAINLYRKLGFEIQSTHRAVIRVEGKFWDAHVLKLCRDSEHS